MTKYESLRMDDKERIADFHGKVRELANEAENLKRPFTQDSLVLKVLRALPESYAMDVKAIRQAHDIKHMTLDQLMGNLETIELEMNEELKRKKNEKPIAFHSLADVDDNEDDIAQDEDFQEQLSLFTRQFKKQWIQKRGKNNFQGESSKGIQFRNTRPREKRQAFMSTSSDDEEETEDVMGNSHCAFVTQYKEENTEDAAEQLTVLQEKWTELLLVHRKNILEKNQLAVEVEDLRKKLDKVKQQLIQTEGEKSDLKYELTQLKSYQRWMKSAGAEKIEEMGLQVNLLSISQICDQGLEVVFTQQKCRIKDRNKLVVLEGDRTADNCYKVIPNILCYAASERDDRLWHYKLGHMNYKDLKVLSNSGAVRGLPKITQADDQGRDEDIWMQSSVKQEVSAVIQYLDAKLEANMEEMRMTLAKQSALEEEHKHLTWLREVVTDNTATEGEPAQGESSQEKEEEVPAMTAIKLFFELLNLVCRVFMSPCLAKSRAGRSAVQQVIYEVLEKGRNTSRCMKLV
ncbi:unnamed protein product [Cuscuta campestris]|uniref:GAG-pre-integrase domain-containing protein n=1 Tax=Cuscuta campestris TaxID=132261 RepID=A0A484MBB2_9ASTE|nr:unnamed protein product [Cuscuta campestris]